MKNIVIKYGLISGAIVSALMGINIFMCTRNPDLDHSMVLGYALMILSLSLIFVGVKTFRDKHNGGAISFGKAFLIGLYISLIASTIYVAVWAVEYKYAYPDFMEQYSAHVIKNMKATGKPQAKIDEQVAEMKMYSDMYKNPIYFSLFTYAEILPVGLVVSLISALILRKRSTGTVVV